MRVLIAEDDRVSMRILQALLVNSGYEVVLAEDGVEAVASLREADIPQLAILDWMMPGKSGIDVCRELRQEPLSQPTYIILLTSKGRKEDLVKGLLAGADDYLTKPFDHTELRARVRVGERVLGLQSDLADRLEELEQESIAKSEILSTATHELKTPLTSIIGYVDRMLNEREMVGPLTQRQERYLEIVGHNSRRLTALVDDLLDVSRIESQALELCPVELDVEREIQDVITSMEAQLDDNRMRVVVDVPHECEIKADRLRFSQVFTNLLSNACKYSPAGSTTTVKVTEKPTMVQVDVTDAGIGISDSDQSKLFTKFFRADNSTKRETSGTGLGLFIANHLVEAHGGRIWAKSEEGKGTTLSFTVPHAGRGPVKRVNVEPKIAEHALRHTGSPPAGNGEGNGSVFEVDV